MTGGEGVGFVSLSPSKEVWSRVTQELPCLIEAAQGTSSTGLQFVGQTTPAPLQLKGAEFQKTGSADLICNHCC